MMENILRIRNAMGGESPRNIILYGAGWEGEKFYCKYADKYNIIYAIDQINNRMFHDVRVYSLKEVKERLNEALIVVAAVWSTYLTIKKQLENDGLKEFDNFVWARDFEKKLCILYGNCHMEILAEYLGNNPHFTKRYAIRRFFSTNDPYDCNMPSECELENCGLLITQDIRHDNKNLFWGVSELRKYISDTCRCVIIPNLYGYNFFFPQAFIPSIEYKHIGKEGVYCEGKTEKEIHDIKRGVMMMGTVADKNIIRLWQEGKNIEQIVWALKEEWIYSAEMIWDNFKENLQRIRDREMQCDIQIADWIEKNYQNEKLFWSPPHPAKTVICEKGRRILDLLQIPLDETVPVRKELDQDEIYIYGCVKKALGLKFEEKYMRRVCRVDNTLTNEPINLYEYVEQAVKWL